MGKIEYVEAILYHKILSSDFTNMYGIKKPKTGGGQTYIQAAGYDESDLDKMFFEANSVDTIEFRDKEKKHPRKKYSVPVYVVGSTKCADLELAPRIGRKDYRISRQNIKNRHPAWSHENGFPIPKKDNDDNYIYEKNYPNIIDCLRILIIKTRAEDRSVRYYATFVNSKEIPVNWPKAVGLEVIFSSKKQGLLFYTEQYIQFHNNMNAPFISGSAVDTELGDIKLPEDISERADDAVEYSGKELSLNVNVADVEFNQVSEPVFKKRTRSSRSINVTKDKDYVRRQKNLKNLGDLGEELVLERERRLLIEAGRKDLADKIDHVSKTIGDGLGYDILSFELYNGDYREKYIEVKATTGGKSKPFDITATEVETSDDKKESFSIYRLFGVHNGMKEVKYYEIRGSIKERFHLVPTSYKAYYKK